MTLQPLNDEDVVFVFTQGHGPGGQHRNKTASACRATHVPTGTVVFIQNNRSQHANKREALKELTRRVYALKEAAKAALLKERRDVAIKDEGYIRTYNFKSGTVKDHRTGKVASLKDVLYKGRLDLLNPNAGDVKYEQQ